MRRVALTPPLIASICGALMSKRTYQPSKVRRNRKHGYRKRASTRAGKQVLKRRIQKGRKRIAVSAYKK